MKNAKYSPSHRFHLSTPKTFSVSHGLVVSGANILGYTETSTITRLRAEAEDDVSFISSSYRVHVVFICFVPNTGMRLVVLGVLIAMLFISS